MKLILVLLAVIRCLNAAVEIMMWMLFVAACFCLGSGIAALICARVTEAVIGLACSCGCIFGCLTSLRVIRSTNRILDDNDL